MIISDQTALGERPYPGESICSFVLRVAHAVSPGWEDVLRDLVSGETLLASAVHRRTIVADVARLAGASEQEISAGMAVPVAESRGRVQIGPFVVGQEHLDQTRRRVAPAALAADIAKGRTPFHRIAWSVRPLPCDPATGEALIERCHACGKLLSWTSVADVGTCDVCGQKLWLLPPAFPSGDIRETAAFFSGLFHPEATCRTNFRRSLPPPIHRWPEADVIELVDSLALLHAAADPHALSNLSAAKRRAVGIGTLLGGVRPISLLLSEPLPKTRQYSDRLAGIVAVGLLRSVIVRSRSAEVRRFLDSVLREALA